jgi:hypothetical protein
MTTNEKLLMLFVILLLGLILCSFLGGRGCSKEGFESASGATITSENGNLMINGEPLTETDGNSNTYKNKDWSVSFDQYGNANATDASGEYTTESFEAEGTEPTSGSSGSSGSSGYYPSSDTSDSYDHYSGSYSTTYTGDNGTATVTKIDDKGRLITVNDSGSIKLYYIPNSGTKGTTKNGPNDGTATIVTNGDNSAYILITMPDGTKYTYYANYNKNQNQNNTSSSSTSTQNDVNNLNSPGSDYANAYVYTGPGGNSAGAVTTPAGNTYVGTNYDTNANANAYYNSLPQGINANQIPPGQEDLYILKSQVVPPVCPRCPDPIVQSSESVDLSKVPPCPPCARCPEPAFDCKKVPNYNAFNPDYMPVPVISDFSGFGM